MTGTIDRLRWQTRPNYPIAMYQDWEQLLFLHWTFEPADIQRTLPAGLRVDTFGDRAWVGIVPFQMRRIHPWWFPSVPYVSNFLELNVRTYVLDSHGRPGVYFYNLYANRWVACAFGRQWFQLPYTWAQLKYSETPNGWIDYSLQERGTQQPLAQFRYRPSGLPAPAQPNTLEFFLVERYLLFTQRNQDLVCGQVHHSPYPLQSAEVAECRHGLLERNRLPANHQPPAHIGFVKGVQVEVFPLTK